MSTFIGDLPGKRFTFLSMANPTKPTGANGRPTKSLGSLVRKIRRLPISPESKDPSARAIGGRATYRSSFTKANASRSYLRDPRRFHKGAYADWHRGFS